MISSVFVPADINRRIISPFDREARSDRATRKTKLTRQLNTISAIGTVASFFVGVDYKVALSCVALWAQCEILLLILIQCTVAIMIQTQ